MKNLIISPAPHAHNNDTVQKTMLNVLIALVPAYLVSLYFFGLGALIVSLTAVVSCVLFEYLIQRFLLKGKNSIVDLSSVVTGLLLAFNLPSNLPLWMIIIGALVAIGIGKMSFGGLGNNPFNPALVGRVFLLISLSKKQMNGETAAGISSDEERIVFLLQQQKGLRELKSAFLRIGVKAGSISI